MPDDVFISEDTVEALRNIEHTLERIEATIKENSNGPFQMVVWFFYGIAILFFATSAWHSKWRYVAQYQLSPQKVKVVKEPHDCDFMYALMGTKLCEYNQKVSTVRWGRAPSNGQAVLSTDDGNTWAPFTPELGVEVPSSSTLEEVNVYWEKKDN